MKILDNIKHIFTNKVVLYLFTRYFTFFLQFVSSLYIAIKLGPYYFGVWGFILMLINYFQIINLGIPYSSTVLLVQHKNDKEKSLNFEKSSFSLVIILDVFILLLAIYYYFFGIAAFEKYEIGNLFYLVCFIAIISHFNYLFTSIFRVKKKLFEVAFFQSSIVLLVFIAMFFSHSKSLLFLLLIAYILAHILSLIVFIKGKQCSFKGKITLMDMQIVLKKGLLLFVYNFCFFMIILSTRTIVSAYYPVDKFGFFVFAYTLSHAILLLLEAFSYLIFPKVIDKFNDSDEVKINATIQMLRINYVSLAHGLMYFALIFFPILLYFMPKYEEALLIINLMALTLLLYSNSYGYNSLLMARNREKIIALNSAFVLGLNIAIALILVLLFKISYEYVAIATMLSYFVYAYLCVYFGKKELKQSTNIFIIFEESFPLRLLLPFLVALLITLTHNKYLLFLPFIIYLLFNQTTIKGIYLSFKKVLTNSNIIDVE